jgi:hypothetical protein
MPIFIRLTLSLLLAIFSNIIFAEAKHNAVIDIYGTSQLSLNVIKKNFAADFQKITDLYFSTEGLTSKSNIDKTAEIISYLQKQIKQMGNFAYLDVTPIHYQDLSNVYFTIDAIDKSDIKRLNSFYPSPNKTYPDPDNLISAWQAYENLIQLKFYKKERIIGVTADNCPVFHCLVPFQGVEYQKYLVIFDAGVPKNKDKLMEILYEDKDETKRAAAAFLLAHLKDSNELMRILVPAMRDPSDKVRNNVMRVIGLAYMMKLKDADFPIQKAIDALDYPTAYDRNKATVILLALSAQPRYARYIMHNAKTQLLALLKLEQPNVHNMVYMILRTISGLKFGERDYASWKHWLDSPLAS